MPASKESQGWFHTRSPGASAADAEWRRDSSHSRKMRSLCIGLTVLAWLFSVSVSAATAEDAVDFAPYRSAADYCRGDVARPLALSLDQRIICFDGRLPANQDLSLVNNLQPGGLFVAHSWGGDDAVMMKLADLLRERDATVVVHGYCILGCASYLVIASAKTVILKNALVAWRPLHEKGGCVGFMHARDKGPPRFDAGPCPNAEKPLLPIPSAIYQLRQKFMETRRVSRTFEVPPQSTKIRKALQTIDWSRANDIADVMWTWHPRYQVSSVKTRIVYEAYPESQEEVSSLARSLRLRAWVLYDP